MSYFNLDSSFWTFKNMKKMTKIESLTDIFKMLKYRIEQIDMECERLNIENQRLKSERYKDEELQKMENKVIAAEQKAKIAENNMRYGFSISEEKHKKICEWIKQHDIEKHRNPKGRHGAIGGNFEYIFTPTSIGTVGICKCGICHKKALNQAYVDGFFNSEKYNRYMKENKGFFTFEDLE